MIENENNVEFLKNQLTAARNEINNLRQQIKSLNYLQKKDVDNLQNILQNFRCEGCKKNQKDSNGSLNTMETKIHDRNHSESVEMRQIGLIKTQFPEKRAVPRQPSINKLKGCIKLNADTFTNPEHSLQGLEEFSHLWIIYHFHKNTSHPKTKVAPPRLGGEKVGLFSTRSPHRPCPIGLSLVEIDKIEDSTIYFTGTDMVDGTPVLDIKPYIPFYDAPTFLESGRLSVGDGIDFYNSRQEPDGEESEYDLNGAVGLSQVQKNSQNLAGSAPTSVVKVPKWVVASNTLRVLFNERAEQQIAELQVERQSIIEVLEADPRSLYLRTKYSSQIFTFQLSEVTVTCKFDDKNLLVTVVQIRRTENVQNDL